MFKIGEDSNKDMTQQYGCRLLADYLQDRKSCFDTKDLGALNHQICDLRRTDGQSVTLRCELVSPRVVQVNFQKFYPYVNFCNFHNFVLTVE